MQTHTHTHKHTHTHFYCQRCQGNLQSWGRCMWRGGLASTDYYIDGLTVDRKDHNGNCRKRDISFWIPRILLSCQNLAPTLPTMQPNPQQFDLRAMTHQTDCWPSTNADRWGSVALVYTVCPAPSAPGWLFQKHTIQTVTTRYVHSHFFAFHPSPKSHTRRHTLNKRDDWRVSSFPGWSSLFRWSISLCRQTSGRFCSCPDWLGRIFGFRRSRGWFGKCPPCRWWCMSDRGQPLLCDLQASVWDQTGHSLLSHCHRTARGPRTHCCRNARSLSCGDRDFCRKTLCARCGPGYCHSSPSSPGGPGWCRRKCHDARGWGHWGQSWGSSSLCWQASRSRSPCPGHPGCRSHPSGCQGTSTRRRCFWCAGELKPGHRPFGSEWRCRRQLESRWRWGPGPSGTLRISAPSSSCLTHMEA